MAVTNIPNVQNWTVTPQNGQTGYFTLMNTWLGQSTLVIASLQTAITAQNTANSEINALATQTANNAIIANGLANYQGAWSSSVSYSKGQSVESTTGSKIYYISKVDSNLNHLVTDTNYWLYSPINDKIDKVTSTDNSIVRFDGVTGQVQNSNVIIADNGNLLLTSGTGALGYDTGAGGTVTQLTSKSTDVTLNKPTGQIIMNNAALATGVSVYFNLYNSLIGSNDTIIINMDRNTGDLAKYKIEYNITSGIVFIKLTNQGNTSYSEALMLKFSIIKGATS